MHPTAKSFEIKVLCLPLHQGQLEECTQDIALARCSWPEAGRAATLPAEVTLCGEE